MRFPALKRPVRYVLFTGTLLIFFSPSQARQGFSPGLGTGLFFFLLVILLVILAASLSMSVKTRNMINEIRQRKKRNKQGHLARHLEDLDSTQIETFLQYRKQRNNASQS